MSLPIPSAPSDVGAYTLIAGGRTVNLPKTINSDDEAVSGTVYHEQIPGSDGLFSTRTPTFDGKSIELSGVIQNAAQLEEVKKALAFKRLTLVRDDLFLPVDLTEFGIRRLASDVWKVSMEFESPSYYWEGQTQTEESGSPTEITYAGHVPVRPTFIVTVGVGGLTTFSIWINSRRAGYSGALIEGDTIMMDGDTASARVSGENALNGMNSSFFVNPPILIPGVNSIEVATDGTATYSVRFYERYL